MFLREGVLKICSKFTGEHPCRSVISIKLLCNIIEITLQHRGLPGKQIKTCLCIYISVLSSIYYLDKPMMFAKFLSKHKRKHSYHVKMLYLILTKVICALNLNRKVLRVTVRMYCSLINITIMFYSKLL